MKPRAIPLEASNSGDTLYDVMMFLDTRHLTRLGAVVDHDPGDEDATARAWRSYALGFTYNLQLPEDSR